MNLKESGYKMLGKYAKVRVTRAMHSVDPEKGFKYGLNFGAVEGICTSSGGVMMAYIMGIDHPVKSFDGRIIGIVHHKSGEDILVVSPKSKRFIVNEIEQAVSFAEKPETYTLDCLYERSCGAVVFNGKGAERTFLLIKNKRSAHWGFPKGHVEKGESFEETALREVFEETGLKVKLIPEFASRSDYTIQGKVEKNVTIFLAKSDTRDVVLQEEEIENSVWLSYTEAMKTLKFENDKSILKKAYAFLQKKRI